MALSGGKPKQVQRDVVELLTNLVQALPYLILVARMTVHYCGDFGARGPKVHSVVTSYPCFDFFLFSEALYT